MNTCYRLLIEFYRLVPIHEDDGIRYWDIWVEAEDWLITLSASRYSGPIVSTSGISALLRRLITPFASRPSEATMSTAIIPAALRKELLVVGTDAGLWLDRAWNWGNNHPSTVQDLLNTVLEVINSFEVDQPPPPVTVPGLIVRRRQAVIL